MLPETPKESPNSSPHADLNDALINVDLLCKLPLPPRLNSDTTTESGDWEFYYQASTDVLADLTQLFTLIPQRYFNEVKSHKQLVGLAEEGKQLALMLYSWRCCSIAVPQIKSHNQPNRMEIYQKTVDVLGPEIDKIRKFMTYQRSAMDCVKGELQRLVQADEGKSEYVSDIYYLSLARLLDAFAVLEEIKTIKTSLRNDYSTYRRAVEIVTRPDAEATKEAQEMSIFLGTHNAFRTFLKCKLQDVTGHEDIIIDLVNACLRMIESDHYMYPEEKYMLVRAIGFSISLIDGPKVNINKLEGKRKINLTKVDKLFKECEVVPLFGDMAIAPHRYMQTSPNYDESKWPYCTDPARPSLQQDITSPIQRLRTAHDRLLCDLALVERELPEEKFDKGDKPEVKWPGSDKDRKLNRLGLDVLRYLSEVSCRIQELVSWKLLHPTDIRANPNCPEDAEEYEKATRYNYRMEEKNALVEAIALLKGAHAQAVRMTTRIEKAVKRCAYAQLQELVQRCIRHAIRKSIKHKRDILKGVLAVIHLLCAELMGDKNADIDVIMEGKKLEESELKIPEDVSGPGQTRFYLLRSLLESLVEKTSNKKTFRTHLESHQVTAIENYLKSSFLLPHLLNFQESVRRCSELSQLWYREFYIEMTLGRRIQFPIQMSLPWILTDHVAESKDAAMMGYLLSPMELYNDSADFALRHFRRQYMFDEIEAEVNLCLDQLIYKLSEEIFAHYKHLAASVFLDKKFRNLCQTHGLKINRPRPARYVQLLNLSNMQLMGRNIDMKRLLTQRLNEALHKSVDVAISRFECGDITGVVELLGLLEVNRLTHTLLSAHVQLDLFSHILNEANKSVVTPYGRISLYLCLELNSDFLPHFCYNAATNRFVRTTFPLAEVLEHDKPPSVKHAYLWGTKSLATCFQTIYSLYSNFVGAPHLEAICSLLGYQDMAVIIKQLLDTMKDLIQVQLYPYVEALLRVMPKRCIMPRFEYGSSGILGYYLAQLNDILLYSDLQPKVFQGLREIGNAVVFCMLVSKTLSTVEVFELNQAAPFQHVIPKPLIPKKDKEKMSAEEKEAFLNRTLRQLEAKYKHIHVSAVISSLGGEDDRKLVKQADVITKEKLCTGLSVFQATLKNMATFFKQPLWKGEVHAEKVVVDDSQSFYRIWSAIQFVYCMPKRSANEYTVEQLFGEGLQWAGCTIIALLGQQRMFEAQDFGYHLLKINRVDQKQETLKGVDMRKMVDRIRKFQILNNQIFQVINKYGESGGVPDPVIINIPPPSADRSTVVPDSEESQA